MSYNIDTWRTKVLENLRIPSQVIRQTQDKDGYINITLTKQNKLCIEGGSECLSIICHLDGDDMVVESITNYGDGSGIFHFDYFKKEWLPESKGKLEAVLIWEGGDSITRLTAVDGVVEEKEIEL